MNEKCSIDLVESFVEESFNSNCIQKIFIIRSLPLDRFAIAGYILDIYNHSRSKNRVVEVEPLTKKSTISVVNSDTICL